MGDKRDIIEFFDREGLNVLRTNGRSKPIDDFNILEYYINKYGKRPSLLELSAQNGHDFLSTSVEKIVEKTNGTLLFENKYYNVETKTFIPALVYWDIENGYVIQSGFSKASSIYDKFENKLGVKDDILITSYINILVPTQKADRNEETEKMILDTLYGERIKHTEVVKIGMVAMDDGEPYIKDFDISDRAYELKDLDLHYGEGFKKFDSDLLVRLKRDDKGLVMFYGKPGTGKTFYIRHLLRKLATEEVEVIYLPPTMVSSITDPGFISFISNWIADSEKKCIMVIEDAEPLITRGDRSMGVTNLLNLTDGLLNDILKVQIVVTFNTETKDIDEALLRPERLIAKKEFTDLSPDRVKKVAKKIGVQVEEGRSMSLAEIYAKKKNNIPLVHDDNKRKKIGFM